MKNANGTEATAYEQVVAMFNSRIESGKTEQQFACAAIGHTRLERAFDDVSWQESRFEQMFESGIYETVLAQAAYTKNEDGTAMTDEQALLKSIGYAIEEHTRHLMSNYHRHNSTSALTNAMNEVRRTAIVRALDTLKLAQRWMTGEGR